MEKMPERKLKLSQRLAAIAGYIPKGAAVADIGTDHGYLPVYLAQNGLASRIIASDISPDSLKSAMRSAEKYQVSEKIEFITANGLEGTEKKKLDTIVLAGMGGETIISILEKAPWTLQQKLSLVIQAQSKIGILCAWLRGHGYFIRSGSLTRDNGRLYIIMLVDSEYPAGTLESDEAEMELLEMLSKKSDPLFDDYLNEEIAKARRAAEGQMQAQSSSPAYAAKRLDSLQKLQNK